VTAHEPEQDREAVRWEKIRRGDSAAFDGFYRENAGRLQGFLRLLTGTVQAAEDVTQETFTQLWQSPNGFQPQRGSLRAYLFGIGRKRAAEWRRRQGAMSGAKPPTEAAVLEKNEIAAAINEAFRRLSLEQQSLLWLREVEGQSYAELAEILDIPVGTVRSRLFVAREELRRIWHSAPTETRNRS
jgi:RNA polymerase sigma-70 factor, ECF subfamily